MSKFQHQEGVQTEQSLISDVEIHVIATKLLGIQYAWLCDAARRYHSVMSYANA
jgi:hypothetical protein